MSRRARALLGLVLIVAAGIAVVVWLGPVLAGDSGGPSGVGDAAESPAPGPDDRPAPADSSSATTDPDPAPSAAIPSGAVGATVRYVHDGDTLYLTIDGTDTERTVRLLGIDTPEIGDDAECYGTAARDRVRELLPEGTRVLVTMDTEALDQYGRTLLHLFLPDGTHVNRLLIDEGLAAAMFFRPNFDYEDEFRTAEARAEADRVGMWGAC